MNLAKDQAANAVIWALLLTMPWWMGAVGWATGAIEMTSPASGV